MKGWLLNLVQQRPFQLSLYTNVMTFPLSQQYSDYVQPTLEQWPGYGGIWYQVPDWTSPQVTDHVATTTQPVPAIWQLSEGVDPVSVAGYYMCDCYFNYLWSEQFDTPLIVPSPGTVQMGVSFNCGVMPVADAPQFLEAWPRSDLDDEDEED